MTKIKNCIDLNMHMCACVQCHFIYIIVLLYFIMNLANLAKMWMWQKCGFNDISSDKIYETVFFLEEGVSPGVQLAFASILGETQEPASSEEEEEEEEEQEEDTLSFVDDEDDEDYKVNEVEEEKLEVEEKVKKKTQGRKGGRRRRRKREEEDFDDYDEEEDPSVGDVFALEMKLNRENKKMLKVRRKSLHRCGFPALLVL